MASTSRSFDASGVSPSDAAVTLRSLRRRFAEAFDRAEDPADLARPAGGGLSPVAHAAWTAEALQRIGAALRSVLLTDDPAVDLPPDAPAGGATGSTPPAGTALAALGERAESVADTIANAHGEDWTRTGHTASGPVSALEIARRAVQVGVDHLRAAEAAIGGRPT